MSSKITFSYYMKNQKSPQAIYILFNKRWVIYFKQSPIRFSNFPTYLFNYVVILSVHSPGKLSVGFSHVIYYDSPFPSFGLCSLLDSNIQNLNTRTYDVEQIHQRCQHLLLRINISLDYWECSSS